MAANTGQLIEAVNALYNHPDEKVKKQANHWLEQWQQSLEAWSLSDAILHDRNSPFDAQYFCAQTLRTKVRCPPPLLLIVHVQDSRQGQAEGDRVRKVRLRSEMAKFRKD